jgi:acylphosphatase
VKNLPDGRVEVIADGKNDHLQELLDWLHVGPDFAQVKKVDHEYLKEPEDQSYYRFFIKH